jgi:hypothetical protein
MGLLSCPKTSVNNNNAAEYPRRVQISSTLWWKAEIKVNSEADIKYQISWNYIQQFARLN